MFFLYILQSKLRWIRVSANLEFWPGAFLRYLLVWFLTYEIELHILQLMGNIFSYCTYICIGNIVIFSQTVGGIQWVNSNMIIATASWNFASLFVFLLLLGIQLSVLLSNWALHPKNNTNRMEINHSYKTCV